MIHGILDKIKGNPHITEGTAYTILFTMGLCHLLNDMIQSVIPAIYPLLKENYGFTFAQIGVITLVFQMTSSVFQPFIGRYADRHPQPYFMAAGMGFMLLGLLALAYSTTFMLILASVAVIGCGSSVFHPEASRVAQLASGGKKSLAQSIFQVGGNGGNAIGPLLAAAVVIPAGQHAVGWFAMAAMLAAGLLTRVGHWYSLLLEHVGRIVQVPGLQIIDGYPEEIELNKMLYIGGPLELVRSGLAPHLQVVANTVGLAPDMMGEVMLPGITKATGIDEALRALGMDLSESVAIGDGANDVEMVEHAGLGIAMGNSSPDLLAVADYVTDDVEADGLAKAIAYALSRSSRSRT